ncbi:phosphotyrosine protein [Wolfiporia cocos MD-104 SS10]|uniref:Phosphotyrosine protein n=1 Tax=Wolfiporia cocos (strain MD-104) TaxID=742152 RepID=A0A2H3JP37_WOLCO|nr:phosphotyrosine protein [Wolfiporia cocos MD-104 SS10]
MVEQIAFKENTMLSQRESPPRADSLVSMLRSLTVDDDYFERRALRAACIRRTPLDDFHPQASEIVPGLFVCDVYTATSPAISRGLGITHVVSVVKDNYPRFPRSMKHISIPIDDSREAELLGYLDYTVEWITSALQRKGRVMVHCIWGMSRSASVAIAYIMAAKHIPLENALKLVVARREVVKPNSGFMQQLKVYEHILRIREQKELLRRDS